MALSLINSDTLNAYTGAFQVLALGNMWRRFKSVSVMLRVGTLRRGFCVSSASGAAASNPPKASTARRKRG